MMVSANSAIWMPAEPMVAGPSAWKKRLTSSSHFGQRNAVITPLRNVSPPTSSTSRMPAMNTPQAAAWPGVGKNTATASVATMDTLNRRGAAAGAAERVENAAVQRHQRHEQQIRKRDPCQLDRQRETARIVGKARREQGDHFRSEEQRNDDQKADAAEEDGKYPVGEELCRIGPAL